MSAQQTPIASLDEKISYFTERLKLFGNVIGGWPLNLESTSQKKEIRALWEKDFSHALTLYKEYPNEIDAKLVVAELARMGHNIDVPDAARKADLVLNEIFRIDQFNLRAMVCRASMYVSLAPQFFPDAERLFAKVIELSSPSVDPIIYQGLGFACLHQNKIEAATSHFETYLSLVPNDEKITQLLSQLKSGKRGEVVHVNGALSSTSVIPNTASNKPNEKPWWQFW
ncbi:MAG: hypothetical protein K2P84_05365 [Undibacterium sp.]|nr:hypothetical protein [Undibacterium sp.]